MYTRMRTRVIVICAMTAAAALIASGTAGAGISAASEATSLQTRPAIGVFESEPVTMQSSFGLNSRPSRLAGVVTVPQLEGAMDSRPTIAAENDQQTQINNALNQAGNEFMLGVTTGTLVGGAVGLVAGCAIGAVVGLIGGCIPGLALGAAVGPVVGGAVVGIPAGIAGLVDGYNHLHDTGVISLDS